MYSACLLQPKPYNEVDTSLTLFLNLVMSENTRISPSLFTVKAGHRTTILWLWIKPGLP